MPSSLDVMMVASPAAYTLTDEYKAFIESIVPTLRAHESTESITITPETGHLFRFDMTSFLLDQNVSLEDHLVVLRLNDLNGPQDLDENTTKLLKPDQQFLSQLKQVYRTRL